MTETEEIEVGGIRYWFSAKDKLLFWDFVDAPQRRTPAFVSGRAAATL